jgi:hypothetical protein
MAIESGSKVSASDGRILTLGKLLKSGGAGSIFRINEAAELVAKIYHPQVDHSVYEHKVEAMLTLVPDLPDIDEGGVREVQMAWPRLLLRDHRRQFLGFAMPLLDFQTSVELECVMQERQARAEGLPTGLGAKVTLAANLAGVIAELHRQGHYVVDLKPVNLRFYRRSLHVTMLDCDGCSIRGKDQRFRAPQFTPEYLAPEFHGRGFSGEEQSSDEESQDRFALAVVVFQLLNFGIHPFTGRPASDSVPTDIPGRIARRCYAYGVRPNPKMAPNPASGHAAMPLQLRELFDRAFEGTGLVRPSASDWMTLLREYGQRSSGKLSKCQANAEHEHFTGQACAACARAALLSKAAAAQSSAKQAGRDGARRIVGLATLAQVAAAQTIQSQGPTPSTATASVLISASGMNINFRGFLLIIGGLVVVFLVFFVYSMLHEHGSNDMSQEYSARQDPTSSHTPTAWHDLGPTTSLVDVLAIANGDDKEAIVPQLGRLPHTDPIHVDPDPPGPKCQAALALWKEKTEWIQNDRSFAEDKTLQAYIHDGAEGMEAKFGFGPCRDLYRSSPAILRVMELCTLLRLRSPGANPGIMEDSCREHGVVQAGLDALQGSVVFDGARYPLRWEFLGQAFVVAGDFEGAYASFVITAFVDQRVMVKEERSFPVLHEPWLHDRADILMARAQVKVSKWFEDPVPEEMAARLSQPWPEDPPPEKPAPARKRAKRARQ